MNKFFFIIVIGICLNLPAFAETERELFENGVNFLKQEKNQEAVDAFTAFLEIEPQNPDAFKNRGVAYMKLNRYDEAIDDFERVKKIMPDLKGLYSNLGVAWYYKNEYSKAIENYDKEITRSPDNYFAYFNRAICRSELKEYEQSLQDIIKTLELSPEFYLALCLKGDLYGNMNQTEKAKIAYEKAVLIDPDQAYARDQLKGLMPVSKALVPRGEKKEALSWKIPPKKASKKNITQSSAKSSTKSSGISQSVPPAPASNYELQAGAYQVRKNAVDMLKKLEHNGYKARILELTRPNQTTWYLVRIGGYSLEQEAQSAKIILKNTSGIQSIVRPFGQF